MGSRATHQLPLKTDFDPEDVFYIVRETSPGVWEDFQIARSSLGLELKQASYTITSASILTLNSTPVEIVQPSDSTKSIVPKFIIFDLENSTTPYATNTQLVIGDSNVGSSNYWGIMSLTMAVNGRGVIYSVGYVTPLLMGVGIGDPLTVTVLTGDPTDGDGDLTFTVYYNEI